MKKLWVGFESHHKNILHMDVAMINGFLFPITANTPPWISYVIWGCFFNMGNSDARDY